MENQPAELQKLEGVVERVIYENAETGYAVFEVDAGGTDVVVAGNVGSISHNRPISSSMNPSRCMPVSSLM